MNKGMLEARLREYKPILAERYSVKKIIIYIILA